MKGSQHTDPPRRFGDGAAGRARMRPKALITGGAGFVGTNVAAQLIQSGYHVVVYDNLSRPGVERNLAWLVETFGDHVEVQIADIRDRRSIGRAVAQAACVFHFAAQVAVTTSLADPTVDFEINAGGTLNLLEACRAAASPPPLLYTSTNKVYGNLSDVQMLRNGSRYAPVLSEIRDHGINESLPLDFHSPYGCSKGTADQYVLDYARCYGLPTVVFRMSCIYGPHQCGTEDQGWVAHFVRQAMQRQPITLYGDGRQVRDLLYVDDLVQAMFAAIGHIDLTAGRAFNIGGGPAQSVSLLETVDLIGRLLGERPQTHFAPWRQGDQRYYVSDTRAFQSATGWQPRVGAPEGIELLYQWLREHAAEFAAVFD
jgi:CDP-paratose 2-epimerase